MHTPGYYHLFIILHGYTWQRPLRTQSVPGAIPEHKLTSVPEQLFLQSLLWKALLASKYG